MSTEEKFVTGCDPATGDSTTYSLKERVAEWINERADIDFLGMVQRLADYFPEKEKSGFFDLPNFPSCNHPSHNPPTHLYIPPGKGYRHVCPGCGKVHTIIPQRVSF